MLDLLASLDIPAWGWALLAVGAAIAGLSKTLLPGATTLSVALFAVVLPAKISTGTLLPLLIVGDVFAVIMYRASADLPTLRGLIPNVLLGLLAGAVFLWLAGDASVQRVIGIILLLMLALTLWRRAGGGRQVVETETETEADSGAGSEVDAQGKGAAGASSGTSSATGAAPVHRRGIPAPVYGALGGFTTMVANAGGPVMSMYFLASRFDVKTFLGTSAWFFAAVNIIKVPFLTGLGLITPETLAIDLVLVLALVAAALVGRRLAGRIPLGTFNTLVIVLTAISALYLVF